MRMSDWSSDVCSSDLGEEEVAEQLVGVEHIGGAEGGSHPQEHEDRGESQPPGQPLGHDAHRTDAGQQEQLVVSHGAATYPSQQAATDTKAGTPAHEAGAPCANTYSTAAGPRSEASAEARNSDA